MSDTTETKKTSPRVLGALVALGVANGLWALFLWGELLVARAGGETFCSISEGADCSVLWDAGFASAIHGWTKVPVAGWGLIWSLAATALPLWALIRRSEGDDAEAATGGTRLLGVAGVLAIIVFVVASAVEGTLCIGCVGTYVLVTAYAAVAIGIMSVSGIPWSNGVKQVAGCLVVAFLLLLYPGLRTPAAVDNVTKATLEAAAKTQASHAGTGSSSADQILINYVNSLPPKYKQMLSDSLYIYRKATPIAVPKPRVMHGSKDAPIRIDEWTDARCGHCASYYMTVKELSGATEPGSFNLVPHQFPLDATCNPAAGRKADEPISCVAAKAQICLERHAQALQFTGQLFANQKSLSVNLIYQLAAPYMAEGELRACVEAPATQQILEQDIAAASAFDLDGTPLIVINGGKATSFGPFLYAMILTRGATEHPAFQNLPPPNPNAHMH
jgi:serine/threonine-protein kinase